MATSSRSDPGPRSADEGRVNILIVEDDGIDATLIERALQRSAGSALALTRAPSLEAARQLLRAQPYELVLLDLNLPDSAGLETFFEIERVAEDASVVVLTGMEDPHSSLAAMRAGAEDFLVKGELEASAVARAVRRAVERRAAAEARRLEERRAEEAARARRTATLVTDLAAELDDPVALLTETATYVERRARELVRAVERWHQRSASPDLPAEQRAWVAGFLRELERDFPEECLQELEDARRSTSSAALRTREILASMRGYLGWRATER